MPRGARLTVIDATDGGSRFVIPSMTRGEKAALVVMQDWESLVAK
jgi:hypothetical protein